MGTSAFELLMIPIFRATLGFYLAGFTIVVVSRALRFLFRGAYRRAGRVRLTGFHDPHPLPRPVSRRVRSAGY